MWVMGRTSRTCRASSIPEMKGIRILVSSRSGSGRECRLHTLSGEEYADSSPLSEYESRLAGQGFHRIHKTCLVRLSYIQDIFPWNNNSFALRVRGASTPLPIGRDRVKELRRRLNI